MLIEQAFETLLSATQFGDWTWKQQAIHAAGVMSAHSKSQVNALRHDFRRLDLEALYGPNSQRWLYPPVDIVPRNKRENALLGELRIMVIKSLIHKSASSKQVLEATHAFCPVDSNLVSCQENHVILENMALYGKVLRFEGRFKEASKRLFEAHNFATKIRSRSVVKIGAQCGSVESELGHHKNAVQFLQMEVTILGDRQPLDQGSGRILTLALANAHLLEALWEMQSGAFHEQGFEAAEKHLNWLDNVYRAIRKPGLIMKQRIFSVKCGLAMIHHARAEHHARVEHELRVAMDWWEMAEEASYWQDRGYTSMITAYSRSQLGFQLRRADANHLYQQATETWRKLGHRRQYHFTGLGTIWPDLLGSWEEARMKRRLMGHSS